MSQRVSDKYPHFQLAKALVAGSAERVAQWQEVLAGIETGELTIGSRTPVAGMPVWATPEIVRGGFSTGRYLAGGQVRTHEQALADELALQYQDTSRLRTALNTWHLTEDGIARLKLMANTGRFECSTPEETALIVVALLAETEPKTVEAILDEISPFFDRLRFFPTPTDRPRGDGVHVRTVGELRQSLHKAKPSLNILQQNATLTVWIPLYDRLTDLLSETSNEDWRNRAIKWTEDYRNADLKHMSRRWRRTDGPFQRCRRVLENRLAGDAPVVDQHYVELVVERRAAKYGLGSSRDAYRAEQARQNVDAWVDALASVMLRRLESFEDKAGIEDIDTVLAPISQPEARTHARTGTQFTAKLARKIRTAHIAPVAELIQGGQISSPEVLAAVLPQVTANLHASGLSDRAERLVFTNLYRTFRQRRSLLLLDLESQVRLEELPWASAMLDRRQTSLADEVAARVALHEMAVLNLVHFPHVQLPNAMIDEMQRLSQRGGIDFPFTREIAADIFMGRFSKPFDRSAKITIDRYADKLYGRYFDLPTQFPRMSLGEYCEQRVRSGGRPSNWSVAWNGMVIEQQLVLTSHNLAALFSKLDLSHIDYSDMSKRTFEWICNRQQIRQADWRAQLQMLKNTAYAWRQMIAFLSELDEQEQFQSYAEIDRFFADQSKAFRNRFAPAMIGLRNALQAKPIDHEAGERFLGWTMGRHRFAPTDSVL